MPRVLPPPPETPPTTSTSAPANRPPEAGYQHSQRSTSSARDDDAVPYNEGDENVNAGGGGGFRKREDFAPLPAGEHTFLGYVNQIMPWDWAATVGFRVLAGPEKDREVDWAQKPSDKMSEKAQKFQRGLMFAAYAHGGWTVAPNEETGWPGWENSTTKGPDGKPYPLPPYDRFFVHRVDDRLVVPVVLEFTVRVDEGFESFPKVVAVAQYEHPERPSVSQLLQAPQPWRVTDWIAKQYGWDGVSEHVNRCRRPVTKLAKDTIRKGAGGLSWWWDALKPDRARRPESTRYHVPDDDMPF